jgi:hypothetical protein
LVKRGFISADAAPAAIAHFEAAAGMLRACDALQGATILDTVADELRNQLADGWGSVHDQRPFEISYTQAPAANGLVSIRVRFGRKP